jgi:hypothetical protein
MARRKQPAGARKGRARTGRHETDYAGEKPVRSAARAVRGGTAAAVEATHRTVQIFERNGEAVGERMQEAGRLWSELAQDALRQNVETAQDLMRCRTLTDILAVQSEWMRRSLENIVGRGARLSALSTEIAVEAMSRFSQVSAGAAR